MLRILDTSDSFLQSFPVGHFDLDAWKAYIDRSVPGAKSLCIEDMENCLSGGYSWEADFLPVLNTVLHDTAKREEAIRSFRSVTKHLEEKIVSKFGKTLVASIILYLGLCNGAGWVTPINGKTSILLGIEKIMELNWCSLDAMNSLILHELGHVYQGQYGVLHREFSVSSEHLLWQLFTEGIAMVFEQEILDDPSYYHQDQDGWKAWCDQHFQQICRSFQEDLPLMTSQNQRYFGDWVRYEGHPDVGYYLGTRFIRFILENDSFDRIISYNMEEVQNAFDRFCLESQSSR